MPKSTTIVRYHGDPRHHTAQRYIAFAERHDLVQYAGYSHCLHLLLKKKRCRDCSGIGPNYYDWKSVTGWNSTGPHYIPHWWDHRHFWRKRGERYVSLVTSEPYFLMEWFPEIKSGLAARGISIAVSDEVSMWNPGNTTLLLLTATEATGVSR